MKKRTIGIIAAAALIIAFAAALILMNGRISSMSLLSYQGVHLGEIMAADIVEMQFVSYDHPTEKRSVTDEALRNELLEELREVIFHGCFQRANGASIGSKPGDGAFSTIILKTSDGKEFCLTAIGHVLDIETPYGSGRYYSNVNPGVRIVVGKAERALNTQG